jgi:hypothetical protein
MDMYNTNEPTSRRVPAYRDTTRGVVISLEVCQLECRLPLFICGCPEHPLYAADVHWRSINPNAVRALHGSAGAKCRTSDSGSGNNVAWRGGFPNFLRIAALMLMSSASQKIVITCQMLCHSPPGQIVSLRVKSQNVRTTRAILHISKQRLCRCSAENSAC